MSATLKYLVTGASGQLGALAIDALLAKVPASEVGALVRRKDAAAALAAKGVTVRIADYNDVAALTAAFAGVERLLMVSSSEVGARAPQHGNIIAAARAAGVGFVAYTSVLRASTSPLKLAGEHVATEEALAASGLHYALLRNGWYVENLLMGLAPAVAQGAFYGASGEGRISGATRADFAAGAVAVLTGPLPQSGTEYELAGDDSYSMAELADFVSQATGKTIPYVNLPEADYAKALEGAGIPAQFAALLADSDTGTAAGGLQETSGTLSRLIGRPTTDWRVTIKAAL